PLLFGREFRDGNRIAFHVTSQADGVAGKLFQGGEVLVGNIVNLAVSHENVFTAVLHALLRAHLVGHLHFRVFVHFHHFGVAGAAGTVADHAGHGSGGGEGGETSGQTNQGEYFADVFH